MGGILHSLRVFFDNLADVDARLLVIGLGLHVLKTMCTSRAWRNVIAASYPEERVRWRSIYAAYLSGVGVNAIIPARGGDVLRVYLAHRAVPSATYTTLTTTYLVLAIFDFSWLFEHGRVLDLLIVALLVGFVALVVWARDRIEDFGARIKQAFAVLTPPRRYLAHVAIWQACDWALRFGVIYFFLGAFHIPQTAKNVLLVQVTQSLATLAPVTPGGIGTEQAFIVYVFGGTVARARLLAFSVGMRVSLITFNAALGFSAIFLVLRTFRFRRHVETTGAEERARP